MSVCVSDTSESALYNSFSYSAVPEVFECTNLGYEDDASVDTCNCNGYEVPSQVARTYSCPLLCKYPDTPEYTCEKSTNALYTIPKASCRGADDETVTPALPRFLCPPGFEVAIGLQGITCINNDKTSRAYDRPDGCESMHYKVDDEGNAMFEDGVNIIMCGDDGEN